MQKRQCGQSLSEYLLKLVLSALSLQVQAYYFPAATSSIAPSSPSRSTRSSICAL